MPSRRRLAPLLAAAVLAVPLFTRARTTTATLDVAVDKPGVTLPASFYGLMSEEINHAYDGGLYAELIQNRTFQDDPAALAHWFLDGPGSLEMVRTDPVTPALPVSLKLTPGGGRSAVANDGFWGIPVRPDTAYTASFYVKGTDGFAGPVTASIVGRDGTVYAKGTSGNVTGGWTKLTVPLKTAAGITETADARFVLSAEGRGAVTFSLVSLFPPTYKDAPGGLRPDLMKLLAGLKPAFIRLPGGNYLEGDDFANRFDWKKMIGPVESRPGHLAPWGYRSSDGMGLPQYMLWCRQLDAEPVLAVFAGYTLKKQLVKAGPELQKYVDEAMEEIEYFTGGPDTEWGKRRVADGQAEPFKLRYVEVGNEDWFDESGSYDGRFAQFFDAIRAKYPDLKIISTMPVQSRRPDLVDDHYYLSPLRMAEQGKHYHDAPRDGPQILLGEWAAQVGSPTPTLKSGLADAAFLCGLEKDADLIPMECYAPLLVNVNPGASQWGTNLIGYDALRSFGSPSYYAQAMLAQNRGDRVLPTKVDVARAAEQAVAPHGGVGVGAWQTQVQYKDLKVTHAGKILTAQDPTQSPDGWHFVGGDWKVQDGALNPPDPAGQFWAYTGDPAWTDYTLTVKARKTGGDEGFLVLWHAVGDDAYHWWNVGGWGNTRTTLEAAKDGERVPYGPSSDFAVETGHWYDLRVEVSGRHVKCYADGKLVTEAEDRPERAASPIYASANTVDASGDVIVKVVNFGTDDVDATLNLHGVAVRPEATVTVLTGDPAAVNSVERPTNVAPETHTVTDATANYSHTFAANSFTVLRFKRL